MSAYDQLTYVYRYFAPYKGRINTLEDGYMAILWPKAVGKPDEYILFQREITPTAFRQNAGLDYNKDGYVIKWEAGARIRKALHDGLLPANIG